MSVHATSASLKSHRSASAAADILGHDAIAGADLMNRPDVDLLIWRRVLPLCLRTWLDQLDPYLLPDLRLLVRPADARRAILPLLEETGTPEEPMRDLLVSDVEALMEIFSDVAGTELVDVRLERVSHDACWKFHRDCVEARLLTTYRGPATEWIQPQYADAALQAQKAFTGPIECLGNDHVAIFKGSCAGPGSGIVHRSPPIAQTGLTRLLFCLNKPSVASPDPWLPIP